MPEFVAPLKQLREEFGIRRIFYPGCWTDTFSLREAFEPEEILYMDNNPSITTRSSALTRERMPYLVVGDIAKPPFPDEAFDAIFIQGLSDNDKPAKLLGALRTLRVGGVLIHSTDDTGRSDTYIELAEIKAFSNLRQLPYGELFQTVFLKIDK